jgi:predicted RNA-binding Zn ribbon-like protein
MGKNKSRRRGSDPAFPRLLGERLCLDYVNTVEGPRGAHPEEYLLGYPDLVRWGRHVGILGDAAAERLLSAAARWPDQAAAVFGRARALREALTRIFRAVARGDTAEEADLGQLRAEYVAALGHACIAPIAGGYGWVWDAGDESLDRPLWAIARSAVEVLTTGEPARVKECPGAGDCGWLFYDTSKNGSRRWCSMEGCGSRVKMRQQYARARTSSASRE